MEILASLDPENTFSFSTITADDIRRAFSSITSQATGADGMSRGMLQPVLDTLIDFLVVLFNKSITESTFPDAWKRAIIVPVNKIANPTSANDYRPIALLPFLCKLLEKIIFNQLEEYLDSHQLLDPLQCGFRKGHSTQTAIVKLVNDIRTGMESRKITVLVLFDFTKAFDMVSHELLLQKLADLGLSSQCIQWFKSYRTGS